MEHEKAMKYKPRFILKMVLTVLCFLLLVYIAFIKRDAFRLETLKVGGSDNMHMVTKLYKSEGYKQQQSTAIQQALATMGGTDAQGGAQAQDATATAPTTNGTSVDASALASLKKDAYVQGSESARVTILEYSDLLCPYCKRQSDSKVLDQLVAQYGNDVNVIFKHYIVHPDAKRLAEAADCVGEQLGSKGFYSFIAQGFDLTDNSDAGVLTLAKSLGVNEKAFTTCTTSQKYSAAIDNSTKLGNTLFGVTGTPGNVVIDNQKGTFTLIAGAYPITEFQKVIDGILGK